MQVDFFDEAPLGLRASGVSTEQGVPHFHCCLEEFISTLDDLERLAMLLLFEEVKKTGIVLEGEIRQS